MDVVRVTSNEAYEGAPLRHGGEQRAGTEPANRGAARARLEAGLRTQLLQCSAVLTLHDPELREGFRKK